MSTPDIDALDALGQALRALGYRFTTVTPATHARVNARLGNDWAGSLTDIFGWSRPFDHATVPPQLLALMHEAGVAEPFEHGWRSRVRVSSIGDLLFFHSAYPTVEGDAVFFGPDTYRFVRCMNGALDRLDRPVRRAADIGCGAGPAAISIARRYPQAEVFALDINPAALALTAANAVLARTADLVARESNLLAAVDGQFDLIVSNPPYLLDASERAYRHGGGDLGAGLSLAIVDAALARLAPGGTLMLYTGVAIVGGADPFLEAVAARVHGADVSWDYEEIDPDVFGEELEQNHAYGAVDRIAAVWLTVRKPGP